VSWYVAPKRAWPTSQEYNEAIQNAGMSFRDEELRHGTPEEDALGFPKPIAGNFASVYKVRTRGSIWAVRCFSRSLTDQQDRYTHISQHLTRARLPQAVGFTFLPEGLLVGGHWYPILKMEWVTGTTLATYVEQHLHLTNTLDALIDAFLQLVQDLRKREIAHGDLQHGNLLVADESGKPVIRVIDYDGMWVPALAGRDSIEVGHRNYQHPHRSAKHHDLTLDAFSAWVIYASLLALRQDPDVWRRVRASAADDCLLFRKDDFLDPAGSQVFRVLASAKDPAVRSAAEALRSLCPPNSAVVGHAGPSIQASDAASLEWIEKSPWWRFWDRKPQGVSRKVQPHVRTSDARAQSGSGEWWRAVSAEVSPTPPAQTTSGVADGGAPQHLPVARPVGGAAPASQPPYIHQPPQNISMAVDAAARAAVRRLQGEGGVAMEQAIRPANLVSPTFEEVKVYLLQLGLVDIRDATWTLRTTNASCGSCKGPLNPLGAVTCWTCGASLVSWLRGAEPPGVAGAPGQRSTPRPVIAPEPGSSRSGPSASWPSPAAKPVAPQPGPTTPSKSSTTPSGPQRPRWSQLDVEARKALKIGRGRGEYVRRSDLSNVFPDDDLLDAIQGYLTGLGLLEVKGDIWHMSPRDTACLGCFGPLNPVGVTNCRTCIRRLPR